MNNYKLKFIIITFCFAIIQYLCLDFFNVDIFLPIILEYALFEKDKKSGIIISSFIGLIQDFTVGTFLGYNMFFKSLFFFFIFSIKEKIFFKTLFSKTFVLFIFFIIQKYITIIIFNFFKISFLSFSKENIFINLIFFLLLIIILQFIEKKYMRLNES